MENKSKKIGRPTIGPRAMTNAERQQRWRDRVRADAHKLLKELNIK